MKLTKTQQIVLLGAGAVTIAGLAIYFLMFNKPACVEGEEYCNADTGTIWRCTGGVWVDTGVVCGVGDMGQLRVVTSPPCDVDMSVDGVLISAWGVDWVPFAVGDHLLHVADTRGAAAAGGLIVPPDFTFEIRSNTTTSLTLDMALGVVGTPEYFPI